MNRLQNRLKRSESYSMFATEFKDFKEFFKKEPLLSIMWYGYLVALLASIGFGSILLIVVIIAKIIQMI